jgi:hypothetical protein
MMPNNAQFTRRGAFFTVMLIAISLFPGCPKPPPPPGVGKSIKPPPPPPPVRGNYRFWLPGQVRSGLKEFLDYLRTSQQSSRGGRPYLYIILLDETGMDEPVGQGKEEKVKVMTWEDAIGGAVQVIASMEMEEEAIVIGIDDHTLDATDVRLPLEPVPEETVFFPSFKQGLLQKVKSIPLRPLQSKGTDILGALKYGREFASSKSTHIPVLIAFSDMVHQDKDGSFCIHRKSEDILSDAQYIGTYPEGTEGAFFYVKTEYKEVCKHGEKVVDYEDLVNYWRQVFDHVGINVAPLPATS